MTNDKDCGTNKGLRLVESRNQSDIVTLSHCFVVVQFWHPKKTVCTGRDCQGVNETWSCLDSAKLPLAMSVGG